MVKLMGVIAIALMFGVGSIACNKKDDRRGDATETKRDAAGMPSDATRTSKMSDSDLKNAVESKIKSDEQLKSANIDVDANADKNEVTLSGTVPSQDLRAKAVDLAKSAHSGITVNDKIDVKPAA